MQRAVFELPADLAVFEAYCDRHKHSRLAAKRLEVWATPRSGNMLGHHHFVLVVMDGTIDRVEADAQRNVVRRVACDAIKVHRCVSHEGKVDKVELLTYEEATTGKIKVDDGFQFATWQSGEAPTGKPPQQEEHEARSAAQLRGEWLLTAALGLLVAPIGLASALLVMPKRQLAWSLTEYKYNAGAAAAYFPDVLAAAAAASAATEYPAGPLPLGLLGATQNCQQFAEGLAARLGSEHASGRYRICRFDARGEPYGAAWSFF